MSEEDNRLLAEIEALRSSVEALRLQVVAVERRVRNVEQGSSRSISGYSVVSESARGSEAGGASVGASSQGGVSVGPIDPTSQTARAALAEEIGRFLRRCVEGVFRGSSGRDRLSLQSRLYIVVADYEGETYDPPLYYTAFAGVRSRCKQGSLCGRSIFVGFASQWEARVALRAGGFSLPAELRNE